MFKQGLNQSGSGGRLVIPKNSKWSMAAGICMIAAMVFHCLIVVPKCVEEYLGSIIGSIFINMIVWYVPFIIITFLKKKNIRMFIIPLAISLFFAIVPYNTVFKGIFGGIMEYNIFWLCNPVNIAYIGHIASFGVINCFAFNSICFIIICEYIHKNELRSKKKIFYICLSLVIAHVIYYGFAINDVIYYSSEEVIVVEIIRSLIDCILYYAPFIMVICGLDTISICPKCGASLTSAGKFCDNCGEQLSN